MLTPVQQRILKLLSDGEPHSKDEIHKCLEDDQAPVTAIFFHISNLRKILMRKGQGIICENVNRRNFYRQVIFITTNE